MVLYASCLKAYNGNNGLKEIGRLKPDAVLLDIMMPEVDEYEVLREISTETT